MRGPYWSPHPTVTLDGCDFVFQAFWHWQVKNSHFSLGFQLFPAHPSLPRAPVELVSALCGLGLSNFYLCQQLGSKFCQPFLAHLSP